MPNSVLILRSSSRIVARSDASTIETGSSAMMIFGRSMQRPGDHDPLALPA